jgi:methylthioribose-1-phosphate isomerase
MTRTATGAGSEARRRKIEMAIPQHIQWLHPSGLRLLDQRRLPSETVFLDCHTVGAVASAIGEMVVRGAPAIGITAAYGMVLGVPVAGEVRPSAAKKGIREAAHLLKASRPTAVNLAWAVDRMTRLALDLLADGADCESLHDALLDEARRIHEDDVLSCKAIGRHAAPLVPDAARFLTHCNAGALATGGYGTALGVIRAAAEGGKAPTVFCDETRPYLQGARLTAWELSQEGIPATLICDSMAGALLSRSGVDLVVVGADRIARNGDTANKVGTYTLAVMAKRHGIPFYVAAPLSTFDEASPTGESIPIEERAADEVTTFMGTPIAPPGVGACHIAFDVTPADLITAIVTEQGVIQPVNADTIASLLQRRIG